MFILHLDNRGNEFVLLDPPQDVFTQPGCGNLSKQEVQNSLLLREILI